eukprot:TRINITY_DN3888_c0_g1_i1.p1 TRINITY_DN3888_c0_g1~~TRINITY_DN3888_c0_g1_i1.p1  ORF type:complete len:467 (-),score=108.90 TRINITY_DN3888_c0_g1_i1:127-1473(-)
MGSLQILFFALLSLLLSFSFADNSNYCQADLPNYFPAPQNFQLALVQVVTRHGDRAPISVLPDEGVTWTCGSTDINSLSSDYAPSGNQYRRKIYISNNQFSQSIWKGNCVPGQLTDLGVQQHVQMGKQLRQIYGTQFEFISPYYNVSEVYVRSSDVWRTQQSAEANLLGLYPLNTRPRGTIIDINVEPMYVSDVFPNPGICPRINQILQEKKTTSDWTTRQEKLTDLRAKLNLICGTENFTSWSQDTDSFNDNFHGRVCHGIQLPCAGDLCVNDTDLQRLFEQGNWEVNFLSNGTELTRLGVGVFVQEILEVIQNLVLGNQVPKYLMYSTHDTTISNVLGALNALDGFWPPYASHLILETFRDNSQNYFTRVLYNGQILSLPFCSSPSSFCSFEELWQFAKGNIFLNNYKKECFGSSSHSSSPSPSTSAPLSSVKFGDVEHQEVPRKS